MSPGVRSGVPKGRGPGKGGRRKSGFGLFVFLDLYFMCFCPLLLNPGCFYLSASGTGVAGRSDPSTSGGVGPLVPRVAGSGMWLLHFCLVTLWCRPYIYIT